MSFSLWMLVYWWQSMLVHQHFRTFIVTERGDVCIQDEREIHAYDLQKRDCSPNEAIKNLPSSWRPEDS